MKNLALILAVVLSPTGGASLTANNPFAAMTPKDRDTYAHDGYGKDMRWMLREQDLTGDASHPERYKPINR